MGRALDLRSTGRGFKSYSEQKLRNNLGKLFDLRASVTKQYNLVPAKGWWCSAAGKVNAGLVESNGSLPPGGWLTVTCGLTVCTPGSAPGPTLGNEYGKPLPFKCRLMLLCAVVFVCPEQTIVNSCWHQVGSRCWQADQQNGNCY